MLSVKAQTALAEFGQVDVLMEMVIHYLVKSPANMQDKEWFVKLENALHLLEETYREKKATLIDALEGGADGE